MFYDYIHNVCFWVGNPRLFTISEHIKRLKNFKHTKNGDITILCILSIMCDDLENMDREPYEAFKKQSTNTVHIIIKYWFNWGGTVGSMWFVWDKYIKMNDITAKYFATWEDDCIFKHNYWLDDAIKYLDSGYIFVGSLHAGIYNTDFANGTKIIPTNQLNTPRIVPHIPRIDPKQYKWCEDPYIMYFDSLQKIADHIGVFTLAPKNECYTHYDHGVNYGEVGFPTRLHLVGFKFIGLYYREGYDGSFIDLLDSESKYSNSIKIS